MLSPDCCPRQICRDGGKAVWMAENEKRGPKYAALFNLSDEPCCVSTPVDDAGGTELWTGEAAAIREGRLSVRLAPHACAVYRLEG